MTSASVSTVTSDGAGLLCPACRVDLVMSERQGVEIDYCPKCRGVWLDRNELDKIIERSVAQDARQPAPSVPGQPAWGGGEPNYGDRGDSHQRSGHGHGGRGYGGHRRKGFLAELFD